MVEFIHFSKAVKLEEYTLIIPSVSVGNVGQLTVDLLISTHNLEKVATIWHPAIISSVGGDPFTREGTEICTACELYISEKLKLAVMQLRSSIEFKLALNFFTQLMKALSELKLTSIILLTSSFAYELHNINSGHFRYISNDHKMENALRNLNILPMEPVSKGKYLVHGSGFAMKLYKIFNNTKCTVLIKYTSEGDNRPDAIQTLQILYRICNNLEKATVDAVQFPTSWQYVFGNPPPLGIY